MNEKQKKIFVENVPQLIDTKDEERAKGELKDLLALESGLTENEIKWLDIFRNRVSLNLGDIRIIDEIYVRRLG